MTARTRTLLTLTSMSGCMAAFWIWFLLHAVDKL